MLPVGQLINQRPNQTIQNEISDSSDYLYEIVTVLLGAATLGVLVFQARIYGRQAAIMADQSTLIARQAEISERGLTITQWPYAYVSSHEFVTPIQISKDANPPTVDYTISFYGVSPAIIRAVYEDFIIAPELPKVPDKDQRGWFRPDQIRNPGKDVWSHRIIYDGSKDDYTGMKTNKYLYFFIGRIIYDDLFGNQHLVGFCYQAVRGGGFGRIYGGATYNYRRLQKDEERI
jgi:hypothetical protein